MHSKEHVEELIRFARLPASHPVWESLGHLLQSRDSAVGAYLACPLSSLSDEHKDAIEAAGWTWMAWTETWEAPVGDQPRKPKRRMVGESKRRLLGDSAA